MSFAIKLDNALNESRELADVLRSGNVDYDTLRIVVDLLIDAGHDRAAETLRLLLDDAPMTADIEHEVTKAARQLRDAITDHPLADRGTRVSIDPTMHTVRILVLSKCVKSTELHVSETARISLTVTSGGDATGYITADDAQGNQLPVVNFSSFDELLEQLDDEAHDLAAVTYALVVISGIGHDAKSKTSHEATGQVRVRTSYLNRAFDEFRHGLRSAVRIMVASPYERDEELEQRGVAEANSAIEALLRKCTELSKGVPEKIAQHMRKSVEHSIYMTRNTYLAQARWYNLVIGRVLNRVLQQEFPD